MALSADPDFLSNSLENNSQFFSCSTAFTVFNESTNSYQYYRSFENCGTIKITTYSFVNDIIAGTFSCKVRNSSNPLDEIEISQGRFDINPVTILDKRFP